MYTICLIDAFGALKLFNETQLFISRQVAGADIVAVNKIDLVDDALREKISVIIHDMSPSSKIVFISAKDGTGVSELVQMLEVKE
jgi:G3E family GTPase